MLYIVGELKYNTIKGSKTVSKTELDKGNVSFSTGVYSTSGPTLAKSNSRNSISESKKNQTFPTNSAHITKELNGLSVKMGYLK